MYGTFVIHVRILIITSLWSNDCIAQINFIFCAPSSCLKHVICTIEFGKSSTEIDKKRSASLPHFEFRMRRKQKELKFQMDDITFKALLKQHQTGNSSQIA